MINLNDKSNEIYNSLKVYLRYNSEPIALQGKIKRFEENENEKMTFLETENGRIMLHSEDISAIVFFV